MIGAVIITGGCGFLGSHLAEYFLRLNIDVVCVDNFCTGSRQNGEFLKSKFNDRVTIIEADVVSDWNLITEKISSLNLPISYIFHFASPASPPHYQRLALETMWVNSLGLSNCLEFADSLNARVIFASTSEVYGDPKITPQPESYWGNVNSFGYRACYDESKRFGEALIFSYNQQKKTNHGVVRIFNTYGPRMNLDDGRVIINFILQALNQENLTIYGDGTQTRSFCYVDDLVEAIVAYAKCTYTAPINIGNDKEFSIIELAEVLQEVLPQKKLKFNFCKLPADDPKRRKPDLSLAKIKLAPWEPRVSLKDGLSKMIQWQKTIR